MKITVVLVTLLVAIFACGAAETEKKPLPDIDESTFEALKSYLDKHALAPDAYVVSKFEYHDVVILGEMHRHKHQVEFVGRLIPSLYEAGVYSLATEFARREDQPLIDSLLALPEYDEALARRITFLQLVFWGYQEYVDIFRAAWELNHGLPEGAKRFWIYAVGGSPDWTLIKTEEDANDDSVKRKVWKGQGEELWAKVILGRVEKGEKVLVYCGINHGFTKFGQPIVNGRGEFVRYYRERMGNYVFEEIGERAITVYLHAPWNDISGKGYTYPADGFVDALMHRLGDDYYPVGFDVPGTPFADLPGETARYSPGYDPFRLGLFCDGYVFFKPLSQHVGVTAIPDWINASNLDYAREWSPNPKYRDASAEKFNSGILKDRNIEKRYRKLQ